MTQVTSAHHRSPHHPAGAPAGRVHFAHPSERLFAAQLLLRSPPVSGFRPDFWLPGRGVFIELTTAEQRLVTRKNGKVRRMRELYPEVPVLVVYQRDFLALLEAHGLDLDQPSAA